MMNQVTLRGSCLEYASDELKNNYDVAKKAVERHFNNIRYVSTSMEWFRELALLAVKQRGTALLILDSLKDDLEVCLKAIKDDPRAYKYASDRLQKNYDILFALITCIIGNKDNSIDRGYTIETKYICYFMDKIPKNYIQFIYTNNIGNVLCLYESKKELTRIKNFILVRTSNPLNFLNMWEYDISFEFEYTKEKLKFW